MIDLPFVPNRPEKVHKFQSNLFIGQLIRMRVPFSRFPIFFFQIIIRFRQTIEKIEYNPDNHPSGGVWVIAFTEIMVFGDVVLRGEGKLIPTTELSANVAADVETVPVLDTSSFSSGAGFSYIND